MSWSGAEIIQCTLNCISLLMVLISLGIPDWSTVRSFDVVVEFGLFMRRMCKNTGGNCRVSNRDMDGLAGHEQTSLWCTIVVAVLCFMCIALLLVLVRLYNHKRVTLLSLSLVITQGIATVLQVCSVITYSIGTSSSATGAVVGDGWCIALIAAVFLVFSFVAAFMVHIDFSYHIRCGLHDHASIQDRVSNAAGEWNPQAWIDQSHQFVPSTGSLSKIMGKVRKLSTSVGNSSNSVMQLNQSQY